MNQMLIEAITNSSSISFEYQKEGEITTTKRIIDPVIYGIKEDAGKELLGGIESGTSSFKMFKVSGIKNLSISTLEDIATSNPFPRKVNWFKIYAER
jgi:predicted DNA-binding transcriptional regulator YafY